MRSLESVGVTLLAALALLLSGCTPPPVPSPQEPSEAGPVVVERGDLESVVVVEGVVVPRPQFLLLAPRDGHIDRVAQPGEEVAAGGTAARLDGRDIAAAHAITVLSARVHRGHVKANVPVLEVESTGWGVELTVPATDLYRLYREPVLGTVNVDHGPAGMPCEFATPLDVGGEIAESGRMLCLITTDHALAPGLSARIGIPTATREDVLTIPLSSVSGRAQSGRVTRIVADGSTEDVTIELGVTDGVRIEVTAGLSEGDLIAAFPPGLQ